MNTSWAIAGISLAAGAAWLYSKRVSPDESGETPTELENSDKPSFSNLSRTNPVRYRGSREWVNTFDTTCGWTPDEQYCPNGIINAIGCSADCTRVFYQLSEEQKDLAFGNHIRYSNWSEDASNCGQLSLINELCVWPFPSETVNPPGCDPIRVRAKRPDRFIQGENFDVAIDMQLLGLIDNFKSCDPDRPIYHWCAEGEVGRDYAIKIDSIELVGNSQGGGTNTVLARVMVDNTTVPPTYQVDNVSNWGNRRTVSAGTWDIDFECWVGLIDGKGDGWKDKSGTYDYTYTRQEFTVDYDDLNEDGYYNGVYDLKVQINMGREIDSALPEWAEGCEFNKTVNLTVPNYVMIYSPETCESCEGGKVTMDNFCGNYGAFKSGDEGDDCDWRAKYNYTVLENGRLSRKSAWSEAPRDSKCCDACWGGLVCTDESKEQEEPQVNEAERNNSETIFPRNGFMIW